MLKRPLGALLLLFVLAPARSARGDDAEPRYKNGAQGAFLGESLAITPNGDAIMSELGGESAGLRSFDDRRWLLRWDVRLAAKGGLFGNQHPFLFLIGMHSIAWIADGYRLMHDKPWSLYAGGRAASDLQLMAHPGLAGSALNTINSMDGVGGVVAQGSLRLEAGVSYLDARRSLLLVAFAQEALQAPQTNTPGFAFTQGGLGARFDIARSLIAELDAAWGVTPARHDALRGSSDQTTRIGVSAGLRAIFSNGMWVGGAGLLSRDSDQIAYQNGLTYDTANPLMFSVELLFGVPLWRQK